VLGLCTTGSGRPHRSTAQVISELRSIFLVARQRRVAPEAEETPHATCVVVVIYGEATAGPARLPADGAPVLLPREQRRVP